MAETSETASSHIEEELLAIAAKRDARVQELLALAGKNPGAATILNSLSDREYQVFWLLLTGDQARHIAEQLRISPKTLDTYKAAILRKLGLENRIALVRWAIREGVTEA